MITTLTYLITLISRVFKSHLMALTTLKVLKR
jgi:hypothetical protein